MTGLTGYVRRFQYGKKMRIWETCTILAEKEFKKLQDQADFNKRYDPWSYIARFLFSIVTFAIAGTTIVSITLNNLLIPLGLGENLSSHPVSSISEAFLEENDSTMLLFLSLAIAHIFTGVSFFFIMSAFHGNVTVG